MILNCNPKNKILGIKYISGVTYFSVRTVRFDKLFKLLRSG